VTAELTIVVPTYNERENIRPLFNAVERVLGDKSWELIFVDDDSPDGTSDAVKEIALTDPRIRSIRRIGRKGLSSACIEGILASTSPYICIMDADMQHDEKIIPDMLNQLVVNKKDIVVGSRYIEEGSTGELSRQRVWVSRTATRLGSLLLRVPVSDPMSGFFMLTRDFFDSVVYQLSGKGFKILLDILVSSRRPVEVTEVPYIMRQRDRGESKLNAIVMWEFVSLFIEKMLGRIFPSRFIAFTLVGFSGLFLHLCVLWFMHRYLEQLFFPSQAMATFVAMTSNYMLNNYFTYRDRRLHGADFFKGLLSFYIACSFGALINLALASLLFDFSFPWWLAGAIGAVAGAVWNYAVTAIITWREPKPGEVE
jgi:dolichol-phosphate mannosyltransferase